MGQKDLSQKNLEMYPDVFADIMNALLHEGKKVLKDDQLAWRRPKQYTEQAERN